MQIITMEHSNGNILKSSSIYEEKQQGNKIYKTIFPAKETKCIVINLTEEEKQSSLKVYKM